jgi:hypothetical protein
MDGSYGVVTRTDNLWTAAMHQRDGNIVVLFQGGRLPSWGRLSVEEQNRFSQSHVDLMLTVAQQYQLRRLEGFRLLGPQDAWQRFWLIEFPALAGAEAWIEAEMAPPYGRYGYYNYHLSRKLDPERFSAWVTDPAPPVVPLADDPHTIPELKADTGSVVVLMFARYRAGAESLTPQERGDDQHVALMTGLARQYGLMRLEAFQLITPQDEWHRAWVIELPTLEAAEAWIAGEETPPHGAHASRTYQLARRWAPEYCASWTPSG